MNFISRPVTALLVGDLIVQNGSELHIVLGMNDRRFMENANLKHPELFTEVFLFGGRDGQGQFSTWIAMKHESAQVLT